MFKIFNFLFKDESSKWEPGYKIPLSLNLQTESLNNVRIGDSFEKLRVFGRPDNSQPFRNERFDYYLLGVEVDGQDGKIQTFVFWINEQSSMGDRVQAKFANCEVNLITTNGRQLNINRFTRLSDAEQILGVSPEKEIDEELNCMTATYRQGRLALYFECHRDGSIEEMFIEPWAD